jgi:hypothetical protein
MHLDIDRANKYVIYSSFFHGAFDIQSIGIILPPFQHFYPAMSGFNQDYFLAISAPELSKENMEARRTVGNNQLITHIEHSMRHNGARFKCILPGDQ